MVATVWWSSHPATSHPIVATVWSSHPTTSHPMVATVWWSSHPATSHPVVAAVWWSNQWSMENTCATQLLSSNFEIRCDVTGSRFSISDKTLQRACFAMIRYHQPDKIIAQLTFPKWLVLVCTIHMSLWMLQTETSHLWKVSCAIISLGWRYTTRSFHGNLPDIRNLPHVTPRLISKLDIEYSRVTILLLMHSTSDNTVLHCWSLLNLETKLGVNIIVSIYYFIAFLSFIYHSVFTM